MINLLHIHRGMYYDCFDKLYMIIINERQVLLFAVRIVVDVRELLHESGQGC